MSELLSFRLCYPTTEPVGRHAARLQDYQRMTCEKAEDDGSSVEAGRMMAGHLVVRIGCRTGPVVPDHGIIHQFDQALFPSSAVAVHHRVRCYGVCRVGGTQKVASCPFLDEMWDGRQTLVLAFAAIVGDGRVISAVKCKEWDVMSGR